MRLTALFMCVFSLHLSAKSSAQTISLTAKNVPLLQIFSEIKKQTGYVVFYQQDALKDAVPVTVSVKQEALESFLREILKDQQLDFSIKNQNIILRRKDAAVFVIPKLPPPEIAGVVLTEEGESLPGANIQVKGGTQRTSTDADGHFRIPAEAGDVLVITFIGFQQQEVRVGNRKMLTIALKAAISALDAAVVQGYGVTSKRNNAGNIYTVSGKELEMSPVPNPLAALQGRVPGVIITQTSGVPGAAFKVEIRGRTQVDRFAGGTGGANDQPLFIIDGVPMASNNDNINLLQSAISASSTSGLSPFNGINIADIESISLLKDADATAIYGSRGANGVVLVTTRRGKAGNLRFNINASTGASRAPLPKMLSTKEYVAMRNEAFANDGIAKNNTNAYDLLLWDTTRDNNLTKQLIGGTSSYTNIQASASGGTTTLQYRVGGGYYRETDVYPGTFPNTRSSANFSITSRSKDQKFTMVVNGTYTSSKNTSTATDLAMKLTLPPNYLLYDSLGNLAWNEKGIISDNPLAYLLQKYSAISNNLLGNLSLAYAILPNLTARANIGYNSIAVEELRITPKTSQNPTKANLVGQAYFGNNNFNSWIFEPQLDYHTYIAKGKLTAMAGATYQNQQNTGYNFMADGYTSDEFLGSLTGIPATGLKQPGSVQSQYKYQAFFGRLNYIYNDRYLVNLSGRRDGSSRFGPNYRFSNFGAAGIGWIFTSENFMKQFPLVSYGKLRASYGVTGNDKIGEYKYLDAYTSNVFTPTYNDSTALVPSQLFKPDLHWEKNKKAEIGLELGLKDDRLLLTVAWYRNLSSDPLVNYPLPYTTGFTTITANLAGVLVENKGWEFSFTSTNIKKKNFEWSSNFNFTLPSNKLLRFPDLEQSAYANALQIGRSLNIVRAARSLGVDPQTGLFTVEDFDKNGTFSTNDFQFLFDTDPQFYGGLSNTIRYRQFQLDFLLQFNRQKNQNWLNATLGGFTPTPVGGLMNVPYLAKDPWRQPGDVKELQKYTTRGSASTSLSGNYAAYFSDAKYSDASFLRLKNVNLSYTLSSAIARKIKMSSVQVYMQAQNLLTFSSYVGADPETVFLSRLPPLRTVTAGLQLNF
ncbi:SusC/RagA family TonB-linked outer membrane protein [Chitinophaga sp. YIM B06452]|uniref:SusC/RagA family TonB-linked outer membrane protein n=1 Tax=Chitinophaga sp. YIM B06452 TaxID=3082158 RepID=UPI0031FE7657